MKNIFTKEMLSGLEWMQVVSQNTAGGIYRVDVRWVLDRYRIQVWRSSGPQKRFDFEALKLVWGARSPRSLWISMMRTICARL